MINLKEFQTTVSDICRASSSLNASPDNPFKCSWEDEIHGSCVNIQPSIPLECLLQDQSSFNSAQSSSRSKGSRSKSNTQSDSAHEYKRDDIYLLIVFMKPTSTYKYAEMASFLVPANTILSDLANSFDCPCDHIIMNNKKELGRFFYFENVFYDDQDLSRFVISWSRDKALLFQRLNMSDTTFMDLTVQIDHPYLYTHAGGCEHVLYIREIRSRMPDDSDDIKCIFKRKVNLPKCDLCELNTPLWISWNDVYAPKSPCFWCESCFQEFHYDKDSNAVYDFDAVNVRIET